MLVTVVANLVYSYRLFVDDKTSYIYETGLKHAESLNDQINFKVREFSTLLAISRNLNLSGQEFEKIIADHDEILAIGEVDSSGKILKIIKNEPVLRREAHKAAFDFNVQVGEQVEYLSPANHRLNELELVQLTPSTSGYLYFPRNKSEIYKTYSFFLTNADAFNKIYNNESTIFTNMHLRLDSHDAKYGNLGKAIGLFPSLKGTLEHQDFLVSFVKSRDSKFAIASVIEKDKAFLVTKWLITKTMLFGGFLLGILIALGVYFSATLTGPIEILTELAEGIAKGNFNQKFTINTKDEIAVLGSAFNQMSSEISQLLLVKEKNIKDLGSANAKLEDYGRNLAKMVEQRTFELKRANDFMGAMVNSLDQGLMVFDQQLKCHDIYTIACERLFEQSPVGKTFYEVLGLKQEGEIDAVKNWSKIIFSELLSFESAVPLGPTSKIVGKDFHDRNFKHIDLTYYPMRDEQQKISNIVAVATDKTKEIQSIEIANEKEAYVNMAIKILYNKAQFQSFLIEVEKIINQLFSCYDVKTKAIDLETAMIQFHTLNGGFGLYNLLPLQKIVRENETQVSQVRSNQLSLAKYQDEFLSIITTLSGEWNKTIVELDQVLNTNFSKGVMTKELVYSKIIEMKVFIDASRDTQLKEKFYNDFIYEPIQDYFYQYDDLVKSLAKSTGKKIKELTIKNGELKIDPVPFKEFFNVLVHLFRNCVDHGIESESARLGLGKSSDGHIGVEFEILKYDNSSKLNITIKDDGAGIDPERIRNKLISLSPGTDFSSLNDKELIAKIFDPFFSTRDEVSALSGRGVGMSAIKEVVDAMNGQIEIESQVGKGSNFSFIIPIST